MEDFSKSDWFDDKPCGYLNSTTHTLVEHCYVNVFSIKLQENHALRYICDLMPLPQRQFNRFHVFFCFFSSIKSKNFSLYAQTLGKRRSFLFLWLNGGCLVIGITPFLTLNGCNIYSMPKFFKYYCYDERSIQTKDPNIAKHREIFRWFVEAHNNELKIDILSAEYRLNAARLVW